mmetsp:Transcript_69299/g.223985  ORF Transcript_69299/g.223985 Transcript_69299/m.223985 type:complete len:450 (+) Transcript_69299:166-1515(+)
MAEQPPKVVSHASIGWFGLQRRRARTLWVAASVYRQVRACRAKAKDLAPEAARREWAELHERVAVQVRTHAEENKGLLVKACQFLSARPDILPAAYVREFARLTDRMPESPMPEVRRVLRAGLGRPLEEAFRDFATPAIGSASIAQVHRAVLHSGEVVAVKVQHEGVDRLIKEDLATLGIIARRVAEREPNFDLRPLLRELALTHPRELDFLAEREALERVRGALERFGSAVAVPRAHPGLCERSVLTMEFMEGLPLLTFADAGLRAKHGVDPRLLLEAIVEAFGIMIFREGFFHADPHPGNFLVRLEPGAPAGAVPVLLDFGLVRALAPGERLPLAKAIAAMAAADLPKLFAAMGELGYKPNKELFSKEGRKELAAFAASLKAGPGERRPLPRLVDDWPGVVVTVLRAVSGLEGLAVSLSAKMTVQKIVGQLAVHARAAIAEPPASRL